ncbi:MAG: LacI family DNA-binding transcriptional regulator [Oscillospiraceae bacterium]|nr:LacI family DNA-binding transcriptional regulator [Oscillospiraceae bacterium]
MVSMKDIALRCGVSVATVSKALNGQPDIGEETRQRIRQTADEMGYLTNSAARALKTNRTYNLGILFVDERRSGLAHEYFSAVLDSLKVEAEAHGYDVTFINRNVGRKPTTYLQHCLYRGVDGVVIACVDFQDPQVLELINSNFPVVTIDHIFNNRAAVVSDNVQGMEALVRYVYDRGCRKLAFLHGERTTVTENRLTGFFRACEALSLPVDPAFVAETVYHDSERCYQITHSLLNRADRPDCLFFSDDFSAVGGLNAIADLGLRIPEDISVVGYDGIPLSRMLSPRLVTYRQDTAAIGRAAASKLVELIEHPKTTLLDRIIIPGRLQEGGSVR